MIPLRPVPIRNKKTPVGDYGKKPSKTAVKRQLSKEKKSRKGK